MPINWEIGIDIYTLYVCVCVKSLQSCPTLCDPMNHSLPGSSIHGDSLGKNTGVDCHDLFQGIFLTQGSKMHLLRLLHWQVGSLPLAPPGKPHIHTAAAAATAKSFQSCLTLCDPIDGSPPTSAVPGILQARTLEWVAISFSNAWKWEVKVKLLSRVWLLATLWTVAHQAPPSMGFSRQEYWSGVPLPSPIYTLLYI